MQKRVFYTRTGRTTCVCVERARPGQCDSDMRVPVCLSACFCGSNPRTVPHLSLNKFRAPLGYRGLVLGLNVSDFFRSLGTVSPMEHVQTQLTRPSGSRRHNYVTKNCWLRAVLAQLGHPPVSVSFYFILLFSCSR